MKIIKEHKINVYYLYDTNLNKVILFRRNEAEFDKELKLLLELCK